MFTGPDPHVDTGVPAMAVGIGLITNNLEEVALAQGLLPVAVNVIVTFPAEISATLGVYLQRVGEFGFWKVPVPLDDQVMVLRFVALEPAVILTAPEVAQVVSFGPAAAVGPFVI
jgi:hypothetical protein